ncbi:MAG: DUF4252 domain-containing protein [Parabacteroides sp.]
MKHLLAILLLSFACQVGYSQNNWEQLFNKFAHVENCDRFHVGGLMMKLAGLFTETMGVNSIDVIDFKSCDESVRNDLHLAIQQMKDPLFETLVSANEEDSRTRILVRIDKEIIRELVIVTTGRENSLIRIKGTIKPSDIDRVIHEHKDGC